MFKRSEPFVTVSHRLDTLLFMRAHKRQQKSGVWMIELGVRLFDRLIVAVGVNPDKKYTFPLEARLGMLRTEQSCQLPRITSISLHAVTGLGISEGAMT